MFKALKQIQFENNEINLNKFPLEFFPENSKE